MGDGSLILLDTHVWIWRHLAPSKLSRAARREIEAKAPIGIPAIACLELSVLVNRGLLKLDRPTLEWIEDALAERDTELVPISPAIAVRAAGLGGTSVTDPADRLIAATAIELDATLITKDQRLLDYAAIRSVW